MVSLIPILSMIAEILCVKNLMNLCNSPSMLFAPHFLEIVLEVKASGPPYLRTVVGGMQGNAPCKILLAPTKPLFMSFEFHGDHTTATRMR